MEIQELKQRLSIVEVAGHLGIKPDKTGRALCPFHDDKNPSLQFSKEKNLATCFSSSCSAGTMDIISLTEKTLKLTTHEALLKLKEWVGVAKSNNNTHTKTDLGKIALLTRLFSYFEKALSAHKQAREYLQSRGLTATNTSVGYNSGSFHFKENKYLLESALKYELIKKTPRGYKAFGQGCLVFPLKNKLRQITGLYFREIDNTKSVHHYYLKDREGLYPSYPNPETTTLILTESIIDAATLIELSLDQNEYSILACYGTNGFTSEHAQAIKELKKLKEIILFFDGDESGRKGSEKTAEQINTILPVCQISIINTPDKEDINSLAPSHDPEIFTYLLENRKPFFFSKEKESINLKENNYQVEALPNPKPKADALNTSNPYKLIYKASTAYYSINGGLRKELDSMKVSLVIEHPKTGFKHRSKLDLYEDKQVEKIAQESSEKLGLRADLVELDLNRLTDLLEEYRDRSLTESEKEEAPAKIVLSPSIANQCRAFLSKPNLTGRLNELIGQAGVIGEEMSRIFLFGIAASYKMPDTLHALIQGSSGSGKTHLLVKISSFIPPEDCKRFTRVTESSFYNYGMYDLTSKLICLEDLDGMKEEAFLAFRELQSRGMISSSTSGKDEQGNIRAYEKTVFGPIASISATTKGEIYEDNMNRCFLIAVDETREQTLKIIQYQNKKAAGLIDTKKEQQITEFIQNCIRVLNPYTVINPYADKINLPEQAHKIRRLNDLYQSYVKQITLLNQYQRKQDNQGRLITEKEDLQTAAEIMFDSIILKIDELDGSLRLFYERLKTYVKAKGGEHYDTYRFNQREIRQALNISKTQLHRYIHDLLELEYIRATGGYANKGFEYKILYWDNITALKSKVKRHLQGQLDQLELLPV